MLTTLLGALLFWGIPMVVGAWVAFMITLEFRSDRIPIILYHRLISKADAERGAVRDDEMIFVSYDISFAEQMAYLQQEGYTTLDFDDLVAIRTGRMKQPSKSILITFDDGYLSNYLFAFPALRRHGQKATIFVPPEPDKHTRELIAGIDGFLSEDQMRELSEHGISIQSHTLTHCVLTEFDDATVRYELEESKRRLTEITKKPVHHIAIPRAGYNRGIRRLVEDAGYQTACCNKKGSANGSSDLLALPRIVIERDMSIDDFARSLAPRAAALIRIVGNIKRIPEYLGGPGFAQKVRGLLYGGPFQALFRTRNLKVALAVGAFVYLAGSLLFTWKMIS